MNRRLEEEYFVWLCAKVTTPEVPHNTYYELLRVLHNTQFVWLHVMDHNRADDGKALRWKYLDQSERDGEDEWADANCSVLEMLIAFSNRAEFQTDIPAREWFWMLIDNLNLTPFDDDHMDAEAVSDIVYTFVMRDFKPNGKGGLFPLRRPKEDQRKVEIWYQFFAYLDEHKRLFPV